jgi:prepilin-type N-terminal cleavage/methylation domain-containing protein
MKNTNRKSQAGFSLIELMIALLLMTIIMGAVFQQIDNMQKRQAHETAKLDIFQNAREFVDQMVRDIHQSGFPNTRMYSSAAIATVSDPTQPQNSSALAVGVVKISPTEVLFEGDVDGDGRVDSVYYRLDTNTGATGNSNCPCLKRSQVAKVDGTAPTAQATLFTTELENVVATNPDGTPAAVFEAYDQNGNQIALPTAGLTRTDWTNNPVTTDQVRQVWTIRIRLDVKSKVTDIGASTKPEVFLTASAQPLN